MFLFVQPLSYAFAAKKPSVLSPAAIVMDAESGEVLFEKDAYSSYYPASCTKILTAILAIESCQDPLSDITMQTEVAMSHNAIFGFDRDSSHIALDEGEIVTVEDLLHGLLLASANECALALAETVSGSVEDFIKLMNKKAKEIGVQKTCNFVNPHGLFNNAHTASAYDLALLMQYCVKNDTFLEISSKTLYSIPPTNKSDEPHTFHNCYKMLSNGSYYYPDMICGKTGWTTKSLGSLVNYARHESTNTSLIVVTTGSKTNIDGYKDVKKLLDYFFDVYVHPEEIETPLTLSENADRSAKPRSIVAEVMLAGGISEQENKNSLSTVLIYSAITVIVLKFLSAIFTKKRKRKKHNRYIKSNRRPKHIPRRRI